MTNKYNMLKNTLKLEFVGIDEEDQTHSFDTREEVIDAGYEMLKDIRVLIKETDYFKDTSIEIDKENFSIEVIEKSDKSKIAKIYIMNLEEEEEKVGN